MEHCSNGEMCVGGFSRYTFCRCCEFHEGRGRITNVQAGLPDSAQAIVIISLCYAVFPALGIDFHIRGTILALPDLVGPLL